MCKLLYDKKSSDSLLADLLAILSHLSRKSEEVVVAVIRILSGTDEKSPFLILVDCLSGNPVVKSRCCNMLGNIMKHNGAFYEVLKKNKPLFESIARCCQTEELNVRKVIASFCFAVNSAVFTRVFVCTERYLCDWKLDLSQRSSMQQCGRDSAGFGESVERLVCQDPISFDWLV